MDFNFTQSKQATVKVIDAPWFTPPGILCLLTFITRLFNTSVAWNPKMKMADVSTLFRSYNGVIKTMNVLLNGQENHVFAENENNIIFLSVK